MPAPQIDPNEPIDERMCAVRTTPDGTRELLCTGCYAFVRTHDFGGRRVYKAQPHAMWAMQHKPDCKVFEAYREMLRKEL